MTVDHSASANSAAPALPQSGPGSPTASTFWATPTSTFLNKESIQQLAGTAARQMAFRTGDDLREILQRLGGRICFSDQMGESFDWALYVWGEGDFEVFMSRLDSPNAERVELAHILGHYVLHYVYRRQKGNSVPVLRVPRHSTDRTEWEANCFAAEFLMPAHEFAGRVHAGDRAEALADRFGVLTNHVQTRAEHLGLTLAAPQIPGF
jgi:Zn-dependent peptidase ImmA (M78 family)